MENYHRMSLLSPTVEELPHSETHCPPLNGWGTNGITFWHSLGLQRKQRGPHRLLSTRLVQHVSILLLIILNSNLVDRWTSRDGKLICKPNFVESHVLHWSPVPIFKEYDCYFVVFTVPCFEPSGQQCIHPILLQYWFTCNGRQSPRTRSEPALPLDSAELAAVLSDDGWRPFLKKSNRNHEVSQHGYESPTVRTWGHEGNLR